MIALPDPDRSRAVLIGASTYSHLENLPAVHNDLAGFRDVLIDPALGGLPADKCTKLEDPPSPRAVYRALCADATAAGDTLLVYFAGHGRTGTRNELYLCLPDTDPDELWFTALAYELLRQAVAASPATKKVVILDCCFSGRALADLAGDAEAIVGQVGIEGSYILTATAANAVALAPRGERYTAFTGALLSLLRTGIRGGPELLTFAAIYPYLRFTLTSRQLPQPRQQGSDTIAHLALTRNPAYVRHAALSSRNDRAAQLLTDAERAAQSLTRKSQKASALTDVAKALAATDPGRATRLFADAERAAQSLPDEWQKASALTEIAKALAATDPGRAERIAQSLTREYQKASALTDVAKALAATDPGRAERIAQSITGEHEKASALTEVAKALAATDPDRAARLLFDADRAAWSITDGNRKASTLTEVAKALAATEPDRAERIARSLTGEHEYASALTEVAKALAAKPL